MCAHLLDDRLHFTCYTMRQLALFEKIQLFLKLFLERAEDA